MEERFDEVDKKIDERFGVLSNKIDMLDVKIDERVDDLAAMTARGFSEVNDRLDNIDGRLEYVEENYATKADLVSFGKDVNLMIGKHLGIFQKEHDGLAKRTKDLEKMVFAT